MRRYRSFPWLSFTGAVIIVGVFLGVAFEISQTAIIIILVVGSLTFASMAVWRHANIHATGDEWWQDDSASGWRGY